MQRAIVPLSLFLLLLATTYPVQAQSATVTIRIRQENGTPVPLEEVRIVWLPGQEAQMALTDQSGTAQFTLPRGMYEVHFSPPLDEVSLLAVAEGGLSSFGITVGDEAIAYSFVYHSDGRLYFDETPNSESATPIIPLLAELHFVNGVQQPTPTFNLPDVPSAIDADPQVEAGGEQEDEQTTAVFLFALLGIVGAFFLWRYRQHRQENGELDA